jgi:AbrB family looped-hinge helix DNA binding protein
MGRVEASAKLSSKSQVVIPKAVRERIGVGPGDLVVFEEQDGEVVVRRAPKAAQDDPFAVFNEWASPADAEAYGDL